MASAPTGNKIPGNVVKTLSLSAECFYICSNTFGMHIFFLANQKLLIEVLNELRELIKLREYIDFG